MSGVEFERKASGCIAGSFENECLAAQMRPYHPRSGGPKIACFRTGEFVVPEEFEHLVECRNTRFNAGCVLLSEDTMVDLPHCRYCRAQGMVAQITVEMRALR